MKMSCLKFYTPNFVAQTPKPERDGKRRSNCRLDVDQCENRD